MWYELKIDQCHRDEVEQLSEALEETGALSITLTDKNDVPVLEPEPGTTPLWPDVIVNALYAEERDAQHAMNSLMAQYQHLNFSVHQLPDQDWERAWMKDFKPQRFGQNLWICPSWIEPPEPRAINLILDPGLAFGTGTHPTTALCLTWLDQAPLQGKTIIDYGCGSGILALAALKLGAAKAYAVDIDEQALQATLNNAVTNIDDPAQLHVLFPESLNVSVDIVIANILLGPLMNLQNKFKALLKKEGMLIISGILQEQAASLIEAYKADFKHCSSQQMDGWSLLIFTRR
ncbi:50S ribosomal protein L11 methyltransferase [Legionella clemsonensis]|uniref:Ribosomal protein L11 methyltransferase n=1 Tax=Legionella clemsonensis TaxID=1867846 RepID=A0A222P541_9GAMM|nr:50S ribosomal protein L11 methyltransferase [Legionella clemsonensis]ASQ46966.1 Ribosomal protein L11 methyltransferase [Legionella clemsonensis]